jgi:glyoxylate/hydroxypyruvate reductase A
MDKPILALVAPQEYASYYQAELVARLPEVEIVTPDEPERLRLAEFAIAIAPPRGLLKSMTALRCVVAPGAGVERILADPEYPPGLMMARMSQHDLRQRMLEYVLMHALRHHRQVFDLEAQQRDKVWEMRWPQKAAPERTVGMLGLGELGGPIAEALSQVGFKVKGWARSPKTLKGVETFAGEAEFDAFLDGVEILVNLLPLTPETRGLIDARALHRLPQGAAVINAGRGPTVVEADLLAALESGWIDGATLDVFDVEPLPADHPFWTHPRVTVTPHNAASVTGETLAEGMRAVIAAVLEGRDPPQRVDISRGY